MKTISKLFHECAYEIKYQQVGDSVNYAFVESGNTLYIYFQGSNSITDWVRNFLFKKVPYKHQFIPFKVHRGFLKAWKEVEDIIKEKIEEKVATNLTQSYLDLNDNIVKIGPVYEYKWRKIVIVGYSHGGALAAFCHEFVWYNRADLRKRNLITYAFEAPRIYGAFKVDPRLKERWDTFFVVRTNNDIVTHCPPFLFRFCHVGEIIKVKGDTSLVKEWWIPKCVKSHYPQVVYDALLRFEAGD